MVADMYGWWKSFEHYSAPGSRPVAVSRDLEVVERHARANTDDYGKRPVLGTLEGDGWRLVSKLHKSDRLDLDARQIAKYERARAGGSRGSMGEVPPESETAITSVDLDTPQ